MASDADLTVCVRHIPCKVLEPDIAEAIASFGLDASRYEVYLPKRPGRHGRMNNFGYGFVTGREQVDIDAFTELFHGFQFGNIESEKRLKIERRIVTRPCGPSRTRYSSQQSNSDGFVNTRTTSSKTDARCMGSSSSAGLEWPCSESFLSHSANTAGSDTSAARLNEHDYHLSSSASRVQSGSCRSSNFFAHSESEGSFGMPDAYFHVERYSARSSSSYNQHGLFWQTNFFAHGGTAASLDEAVALGDHMYYPSSPSSRVASASSHSNSFVVYGDSAVSFDTAAASRGAGMYYFNSSSPSVACGSSSSNYSFARSDFAAPFHSLATSRGEGINFGAQDFHSKNHCAYSSSSVSFDHRYHGLHDHQCLLDPSVSNSASRLPCSDGTHSHVWPDEQSIGFGEGRNLPDSSNVCLASGSSRSEEFLTSSIPAALLDTTAAYFTVPNPAPEANDIPPTRLGAFTTNE
eukprot:TRINITY_DN22317_c0_g1_i1.p1 TRINITY_DN22317_c0_g1~~TRINITY_DN22317_c0_g1_i1.p1  ORF type:complete len:463 (+),score=22.98 TRINITY_DN22317_c0_g1_i1:50-1438(+)